MKTDTKKQNTKYNTLPFNTAIIGTVYTIYNRN